MRYLAILGRQSLLSVAELESLFSDVHVLAPELAEFSADTEPSIARLGGTIKLAKEIGAKNPADFLVNFVREAGFSGKVVIGVSDYSAKATARAAQGEALRIKRFLKKAGISCRVLPNKTAALSSATVFHNQLGEKPGHFELIKFEKRWFAGIGVQNINAYTARDQKRPARDAKVGMLPPKLAQILINLCGPLPQKVTILDPFCGTGVLLQEAALMEYKVYGTDKEQRMVDYTRKNLEWLAASKTPSETPPSAKSKGLKAIDFSLGLRGIVSEGIFEAADATDYTWKQPIDAVAFEGYLGPPMSQIPADIKIKSVISDLLPLYYHTLKNLSSQIAPKTPVVMAIPAWLRQNGQYQRLKILDEVDKLGYNVVKYKNLSQDDLLYYREGQVVAREIIVLRKK